MFGQDPTDVANGVDDCIGKSFIAKMLAHKIDNSLPVGLPAFFVDRLVANYGEFVGSWRDKYEHGIALRGFMHPEFLESLPRGV